MCFVLNSCATLASVTSIVGSAATTERGLAKTVEDTYLMTKIMTKVSALNLSNLANIKVSVAFGNVLISGNSETHEKRLQIINSIWEVDDVKTIYNEIHIGDALSIDERAKDLYLKSLIKARLLLKSGIYSNNYSIDVVKENVYVIGLATDLDEKSNVETYLEEMKDIKKLVTIISFPRQPQK